MLNENISSNIYQNDFENQKSNAFQDQNEEEQKKKNLWDTLLKSVGQRNEIRQAHILILGDKKTGKKSLIKAINKPFLKQLGIQLSIFEEIGSEYSLFESSYLYVKENIEYAAEAEAGQNILNSEENLARINVWIISDPEVGSMINKILTPKDLENTFAIILPDLEEPWEIMNQCEKWIKVLKDSIFQISRELDLKTLEFLRERIVDLFKTYEEPEVDKDGKLINKKINKKKLNEQQSNQDRQLLDDQDMIEDLRKEMELSDGILVTNLFIPVMVVCTKTDLIEHGENQIKNILEQNLDFIQYKLREFCIQYGSSLVFASANSNSNIQLIYQYILSRIFNCDFCHQSNTTDKEALFIPSGFDSPELISKIDIRKFKQMLPNNIDLDVPSYNDIVKKPASKQGLNEESKEEIQCPDWKKKLEEHFLKKDEKPQPIISKQLKPKKVDPSQLNIDKK